MTNGDKFKEVEEFLKWIKENPLKVDRISLGLASGEKNTVTGWKCLIWK